MFEQQIRDGEQKECPDYWLTYGNPWEIERQDVHYPVGFYGKVVSLSMDEKGRIRKLWEPKEKVYAVAHDVPVPGYRNKTCLNVRLWSGKPAREFDLSSFNVGDYFRAVESRHQSETISAVLYPNDNTRAGKELRLKQQYFFASATVQDILRRFHRDRGSMGWADLPSRMVIHLNDTMGSIAIVELLRLLVDAEGLSVDEAWPIVRQCFTYTNHTVMPEALEKWPVEIMETLLPRHMELIYDINWRFLEDKSKDIFKSDMEKRRSVSLIEEGFSRSVRMANLCVIGSTSVNGVAAIHSEILKDNVFKFFHELWPTKFSNVTNGVTPRRWLMQANPELTRVITQWLNQANWATDMGQLRKLCEFADNPDFQSQWREAKLKCKRVCADYLRSICGVEVGDVRGTLFDIQIKRIHEYKRQLMNILYVIDRYDRIKQMTSEEKRRVVPRVVIFAGKAAPGYQMAKLHIRLINAVLTVVNRDEDVNDWLKVAFVPNYNVSVAEVLIPASDISQHISTAGTEASGTGCMKFVMNGGLLLGTYDGANIEIGEEIGMENAFLFGLRAKDVPAAVEATHRQEIRRHPRLQRVIDLIYSGTFGAFETFVPILESLDLQRDYFLVTADYPAYLEAQEKIDRVYQDPEDWTRRSIHACALSGKFSSDRAVREYTDRIWGITPIK